MCGSWTRAAERGGCGRYAAQVLTDTGGQHMGQRCHQRRGTSSSGIFSSLSRTTQTALNWSSGMLFCWATACRTLRLLTRMRMSSLPRPSFCMDSGVSVHRGVGGCRSLKASVSATAMLAYVVSMAARQAATASW